MFSAFLMTLFCLLYVPQQYGVARSSKSQKYYDSSCHCITSTLLFSFPLPVAYCENEARTRRQLLDVVFNIAMAMTRQSCKAAQINHRLYNIDLITVELEICEEMISSFPLFTPCRVTHTKLQSQLPHRQLP